MQRKGKRKKRKKKDSLDEPVFSPSLSRPKLSRPIVAISFQTEKKSNELKCCFLSTASHWRAHTHESAGKRQECEAHLAVIRSQAKKEVVRTQKPCRTNARAPPLALSPNAEAQIHLSAVKFSAIQRWSIASRPKGSQMRTHLHLKSTSTVSITSNGPYQTTHADLFLLVQKACRCNKRWSEHMQTISED